MKTPEDILYVLHQMELFYSWYSVRMRPHHDDDDDNDDDDYYYSV